MEINISLKITTVYLKVIFQIPYLRNTKITQHVVHTWSKSIDQTETHIITSINIYIKTSGKVHFLFKKYTPSELGNEIYG